MANLNRAKPSPRVENGVLAWYQGDTFRLVIRLRLEDGCGLPVELTGTDSLELRIRNSRGDTVLTETTVGGSLLRGEADLVMDGEKTQRFPAGAYEYDLVLTHGFRTTVAKRNRILVEG